MMAVACPSCKESMQIDSSEANTEWECPSCGAAFLAQATVAGGLEFTVTQPAPANEPKIKDEAYVYAVDSLGKGIKPREIRKGLLEAGYSARQVDQIIQGAIQYKRNHDTQEKTMPGAGNSANRNMLIGGAVCLLGIGVTVFSLSAATQAGGGRYIIAWGAIVFGGIQFFRGLMRSHQS